MIEHDSQRILPLPQLTDKEHNAMIKDKKQHWDVMLLILSSLLVCASIYGFYRSGVMSRGWIASPLTVLVPVYAMILYQVIVSIRRRR